MPARSSRYGAGTRTGCVVDFALIQRNRLNAVDFWATFWATMWGALAGALVGAVAAWLFALDLRRRGADDAYRAMMDAQLARIVEALHAFADELDQSPGGLNARPINSPAPTPRRRAYAEALAALDSALVHANRDDHDVLLELRHAVGRVDKTRVGASQVSGLCDIMLAWKRWSPDDRVGAVAGLKAFQRTNLNAGEALR